MAKIKIEDVIEHLDHEMKQALENAVNEIIPNANFDRQNLYRAFVRNVRRKCSTWENVPDRYIDM